MTSGDEVRVRFWTDTRATPFRVERTLGLREGEAELVIDGTVSNRSTEAAHFVWGHHCVVGPPVPRAGLPTRDPRADDRHHTRAVGAGDRTARAGSARTVAAGAAA